MKIKFAILLIIFLWSTLFFSQNNKLDSLKAAYSVAKHDTIKCKLLLQLYQQRTAFSEMVKDNEDIVSIAQKNLKAPTIDKNLRSFYADKLMNAYNNLGITYRRNGNSAKALEYYDLCINEINKIGDKKSYAFILVNKSTIYLMQGNVTKSLEFLNQSLKISEEIGDKKGHAFALSQLGSLYREQNDLNAALECFNKSRKLYLEAKDNKGLCDTYNNIGGIYMRQKQIQNAFEYYLRFLELSEELKNTRNIGIAYNNLGALETQLNNDSAASGYYEKALTIYEKYSEKSSTSAILTNLGHIKSRQGKYEEAEALLNRSLAISKEANYLTGISNAALHLRSVYQKQGKFEEAIKMYDLYISAKDSLNSKENKKAMLKTQLQLEFEKKEALSKAEFDKQQAIANAELIKKQQEFILLEKENELKELSLNKSQLELKQKDIENENRKKEVELLNKDRLIKENDALQKEEALKKQRLITNGFAIGAAMVLILLFFVLKGYLQKKKDNQTIKAQKQLVEAKQKEVIDSITYAKRLQEAILPATHYWNDNLKDSFVFYKPKDIVAGDFYWMERINDQVFFAAADCTGHGVPGAMVSVVCSNALNRSLLEFGITEPGKMLDKTRELVIATFEKSDKEVKDGMDISLCCLNLKNKTLTWAGANNSLLYTQNNELNVIKPDKQPIGKHENSYPFTTHTVQLNAGDTLYLYTDGYADQFGGLKGKKFKNKMLNELLITNSKESMTLQKEKLEIAFEKWIGKLEQVDDVCVIGVKIE